MTRLLGKLNGAISLESSPASQKPNIRSLNCLSYFSIAVLRQLIEGNLEKKEFTGGFCLSGETTTIMAVSVAAERQGMLELELKLASRCASMKQREQDQECCGLLKPQSPPPETGLLQ